MLLRLSEDFLVVECQMIPKKESSALVKNLIYTRSEDMRD